MWRVRLFGSPQHSRPQLLFRKLNNVVDIPEVKGNYLRFRITFTFPKNTFLYQEHQPAFSKYYAEEILVKNSY